MKKLVVCILTLAMLLCLCACGKGGEKIEKVEPTPVPTVEPTVGPEALAEEAAAKFTAGDYQAAFEQLFDLETGGLPHVQEMLGSCYYLGLGTEANYGDGVELLEKARAQGDAIAAYMLGEASMVGNGIKRDADKAEEYYKEFVAAAANVKIEDAQSGRIMAYLADCYANGKGSYSNGEKAKSIAMTAMDSEGLTPFDMLKLAALFEEKLPGEPDTKNADKLYMMAFEGIEKLAEGGNAVAQKLAGDYYFVPLCDTKLDFDKAFELYSKAAEQGNADAQAQLAYMYLNGYGVEIDYEKAMDWNNRATQQGNAQAQAQIGWMYHQGLGVTRNLDEAGRWYVKAADQGNDWAEEQLAEVETTNPHAAYEFHA